MKTYPEYKDSRVEWIGVIPSHWDSLPVRYVTEDHRQGFYTSDPYDDVGVPILRITDIQEDHSFSHWNSPRYSRPEEEIDNFYVRNGDFLFPRTGGVGRFGIVDFDFPCIYGSFMIRFRWNHSVNQNFMKFFLESNLFTDQVKQEIHGGVNQNVHVENIKDVLFFRPPLDEQQLISRYLDKKTEQIDSLIEKIQKKIELLKEQRISLINQCVTKGLDRNVEMKDSGVEWIGEIPKHWNRVRVKHIVSTKITDGPHETPEFVDEGIPFLSVEGVVGNKINLNRVRGYITPKLHEIYSKKIKPMKEDVLLVKSGSTTGKSTIVDIDVEFNIWSPLCILRSDRSKIDPYYLFNSVQSRYFRIEVETNWSYGTQPNIGMGVIEELWIVLPPVDEQTEINKYLKDKTDVLNGVIDKHLNKITLYKEYRQSLISSVVTGKIRVTEDMI